MGSLLAVWLWPVFLRLNAATRDTASIGHRPVSGQNTSDCLPSISTSVLCLWQGQCACVCALCLQFALASTLYLSAGAALSGFVRRPAHSRGMWLSGISNYLLAFTFAKAIINTLM